MPDLNHRFQAGRMNKDLDERLVPNGEYRDAMNVQIATSDGSDVGSLQNIMGNLDLSSATIDPSGIANDLYVVGSITDEKTDKLYWLVSGGGVDFIAEYDYKTGDVSPIVVDIFPVGTIPGNDSGRVLNFDKRYLITGINIIEDNLFWTDNNTEPKKINITRVRTGSIDFVTHTDFYVPNPTVSSSADYVSVGPIRHEHITVAKKAPKTAPKLEMKYTTRGDLDLDGIAGETETTMTNQSINGFWSQTASPPGYVSTPVQITLDSSPDYKRHDHLIIEADNPSSGGLKKQSMVVEITGGVSSNGVWNNPGTCWVEIMSWDLNLDLSEKNFKVKLKQDDPLFQFKFPRFAYRYKFANGEYSTFSPFSEIAFLPQKFDYVPKEGYNLGMVNAVRSLGVCDFVDERYIPDDVISIDLLYKESNSPSVYSVKTIDRVTPDPNGVFDEWNGISPAAMYDASATPSIQTYGYVNIESEMIHAMLPTNQLLRSWDNIPRKALAQEVVGNRLVYGNYLQNYNMTTVRVQRPTALKYADGFNGQILLPPSDNITVDLKLVLKPRDIAGAEITEELDAGKAYMYRSAKTIKSLRTYQLGVVYIDEFGRETPVFSNAQNKRHTLHVEGVNAPLASKLKAQIFSSKPDWAKHFKFLIKETSNEYYNLAMDRWYPAEDGNIWLSFPASERNKVDLETFLILKKAHDKNLAVTDGGKYKILDIDSRAPRFLRTQRSPKGQIDDETTNATPDFGGLNGLTSSTHFPQPGVRDIDIDVNSPAAAGIVTAIADEGVSDWRFRVVSIDGASKWYSIKYIKKVGNGAYYRFRSVKTFGADMGITTPAGASIPPATGYGGMTIEFVKKEIVNKPEFDGRFFVKILKDARLQEYIVGYALGAQTDFTVTSAIVSQYINPGAPTAQSGGIHGDGNGNWHGYDPDMLSIGNGNTKAPGMAINAGDGDSYWKRAGQDKDYTNADDGQSSGWFIDKVEAFRPFKYNKHFYGDIGNTDHGGYNTNSGQGNIMDQNHWDNVVQGDVPYPTKQLQVIGTNTSQTTGTNSYLGITGVHANGSVLRDASITKNGQIIPSIGIDPETGGSGSGSASNVIHLSYAGAGDSESNGTAFNGSLNDLETALHEWQADYVDEIYFINSITTSGTIWRWAEDPGQVVYRTLSSDPTNPVNTTDNPTMAGDANITSDEWGASKHDYDNKLGTELFNYTNIHDYPVTWLFQHGWTQTSWTNSCLYSGWTQTHYACIPIPVPPWLVEVANTLMTGNTDVSARVSRGVEDYKHSWGFGPVGEGTAVVAWGTQPLSAAFYAGALGVNEIGSGHPLGYYAELTDKAGNLAGQVSNRWPMLIEDWVKSRARRRRYSIHAEPLARPVEVLDNTGQQVAPSIDGTEGLGGIAPHYYLPTNPPDLLPHFDVNGVKITTGPDIAPGIRPDGMYSGMKHPQLDVSSGNFYTINTVNYDKIPTLRRQDDNGNPTPAPGSVTWQILDTYVEDDNDEGYSSTNPAIWETEPKEDVGLEIYHEVGQIYPTELNEKTLEQFFGPIHTDLSRNSQVTSWMPGIGGGWTTMQTNSGVTGDTDIRIALAEMLTGEIAIALKDINGNFLDVNAVALPQVGARLMFQRADGSITEVSIKAVPTTFLPFFAVESDVHNYEVTLPWFNAYSFGGGGFGNGVESNRIRDDYNQVTIDKGPKVSTVLEEPYTEEHRSSGLIYSGIYNTTSGINNLNQFITAEKITKDLNPSYGSIQKLFTRNTNLVTFCEDKVFKILADKDALYNADGNINLTASENVLGQTIPFVGDYGISTNPESFAADSYRAYFADRTRGSVLRLSQDGLTPISSVGMTDWFADNLSASNRIMGNFDDRKSEYNISLNYFDFGRNKVGIKGDSKSGVAPYTPSNILITTYKVASRLEIGDALIGVGIPVGATVVGKAHVGGEWRITMSQGYTNTQLVAPLEPASTYGSFLPNGTFVGYCLWNTEISIAREDDPDPLTLSFSEINKGWVSFKSFHFEDGLSLNNDYFTFKGGQLFKHHANPLHNTFYDTILAQDAFTESSVEVLFNELPGSVKSFQTLNYEGSQSKITADIDNSGEYWDNKDKLGWYVDNMYTNLQEAEPSEFKDKEGKWFSTVKGVATEWLDDGTAGNIDTNEFSYQGIDEAGAKTGDDQYTSWDCVQSTGGTPCSQFLPVYPTIITIPATPPWVGPYGSAFCKWSWDNPQVDLASWSFEDSLGNYRFPYDGNAQILNAQTYPNNSLSLVGVNDLSSAQQAAGVLADSIGVLWTPSGGMSHITSINQWGYTDHLITPATIEELIIWFRDNIDPVAFWVGMTHSQWANAISGGSSMGYVNLFMAGFSSFGCLNRCVNPIPLSPNTSCVEISGLGGAYATESACQADTTSPCAGTCVAINTVLPHPIDATAASGCNDGDGVVEVILAGAATEWSLTYVDPSIWSSHPSGGTVVHVDTNNPYGYNGWSQPATLPQGDYAAYVIDNLGCELTVPFTVDCGTGTGGCPPNPSITNEQIQNPISILGVCTGVGSIALEMLTLNSSSDTWKVEYFSVVSGVSTSIYADPTTYYNGNTATPLNNLVEGDYEYVITEFSAAYPSGCPYTIPFTIECVPGVPGCTDPLATNYDPNATFDDGSCVYPCNGTLIWDPNRSSWISDPNAVPFINNIQLAIGHVISDDCEADPLVMTSNANLVLKIISLPAGASTFSYEVIPGSNVDPYFTPSSGVNIAWLGTTAIPFMANYSLSVPSAIGDWSVIITDDLGNTECYTFTIICEPPPPVGPTWDCDQIWGNCYDPGTGLGQYPTLTDCQLNCEGLQYPHGRYNVFRFGRTHTQPHPENVSLEVLKSPLSSMSNYLNWDKIQSITDLTPGYAAAYGGPIAGSQGSKKYRRYNRDFWPNGLAEITFQVTWQSGHTKTFIMKASVGSPLTHNTLFKNTGGMPQQPPQMYDCYYPPPSGQQIPLQYQHDFQSGSMMATYDPNSDNPIGTISKAEVLSDPAGLLVNHREAYHHMCLCSAPTIVNNKIPAGVWDLESTWGDGFKPNVNSNQEQIIKIHTAVVEANSNLKYQANNGIWYENVLDIVADFSPQQVSSYTGLGEVWTSNGGQNIFNTISDFFQTHGAQGQDSFFFETIVYADELNC